MSRTCLTIILAAGKGLRMHSGVPKILHKIGNLSLINHVLRSVERFNRGGDIAIIVGQQAEMVREQVEEKPGIKFFTQNVPLGTANAVLAAREAIANGYDDILVLYGDTPLIRPETLADLRQSIIDGVQVAVLGFRTRSPGEYGRMIERNGQLMGIREYKDAECC